MEVHVLYEGKYKLSKQGKVEGKIKKHGIHVMFNYRIMKDQIGAL